MRIALSHPSSVPFMAMAELSVVLAALTAPRFTLRPSLPALPPKPGLYAIYGDDRSWEELRLGASQTGLPLYVGKAEDSVVKSDLKTHFEDGRTGSSTVRRSFAALLRATLSLSGRPRNLAKPGYFSNYGLSAADDAKLTQWMRDRLELAVWPADGERPLVVVEDEVLRHWNPPINLTGVTHRWRSIIQAARKVMADEARSWSPETR